MSHLLAISVGPVQEFIAAARRTRDLWFGSYLLSEISRAVARSVEADGGKLIFPASSAAENVANVILAELPTGEPKDVAAKAKQAAQKRWRQFADEAYREASGVIRQDIWDDQVKDVIEFYAAWVHRSDNYSDDRKRLMRLLAGRKNCRDFLPAKGLAGLPKSSLDGQRESVLKQSARANWPVEVIRRLRLSLGEQLDVVGVVKRLGAGRRAYKSVTRIAVDQWIRGLKPEVVREIRALAEQIPDLPQLDDAKFPYDGHLLFVNRHTDYAEENKLDPAKLRPIAEILNRLPEPSPYLAVLVADGDKMGAAISNLPDAQANRNFSEALAGFADSARTIVNDHNGVLVYAGGDDVLAFLPVDKCLSCARKLHDDFVKCLKIYKDDKGNSPTLSVGIAIGHFMENLEDLLDYGRAAEKAAKKPDRDGLAVHLHKRGGGPIRVRAQWSSGVKVKVVLNLQLPVEFDQQNFDERILCYAHLMLAEAIPSKLPYDLRKLADLYATWKNEIEEEKKLVKAAMQADLIRVIRDKQPRAGRRYLSEIEQIVKTIETPKGLSDFTEQLLIARQIATALKQAGVES